MPKIRVLVIEDSLTVRKRIVEVIAASADLEVIAEASDGAKGAELCQTLRPDVVTLDMVLPGMNGVAVTERIMAYCPTPILIVSASFNRGEVLSTYEALAAGALEVLDKPSGDHDEGEGWEAQLVDTLRLISRIKVITHPRGRLDRRPKPSHSIVPSAPQRPRVIAIGASTGGPAAVLEIIKQLPASYSLPILLVIHIGAPFAPAFGDWLAGYSAIPVMYARDGTEIPKAGVVLAPPDKHLVVRGGRLRLIADSPRNSCRPSVDVLFESLATELRGEVTACLLTGMGRDGAAGLLAIRRAGGRTIAQDQATSVVFGMPREAIQLGAADDVLPIGQIGRVIAALGSSS